MTLYRGYACSMELGVDDFGKEVVRMAEPRGAGLGLNHVRARHVSLDDLAEEPALPKQALGDIPLADLAAEGVLDLASGNCTGISRLSGGDYSHELKSLMTLPHPSNYQGSDTSGLSD